MDEYDIHEYDISMWPDQSLLDSVFGHLGISEKGDWKTGDPTLTMLGKQNFGKTLQGYDSTGKPYADGRLKMTRFNGHPYSDDDITTMAMVQLINKHPELKTGEAIAKFLKDNESELENIKKELMDKIPLFKVTDDSGNQVSIQPGQVNLSQKKDLANYFMTDVGKRMHQVTHGSYYPVPNDSSNWDEGGTVKKTGAASDEFEAVYKIILPKLLLIRKMQYFKTQEQLMKQYGLNKTQLAQYLVKLMDDTEKDIQKYLKNGVLISPLMGQNYLKLNMNG